jgi:hypothetical protein
MFINSKWLAAAGLVGLAAAGAAQAAGPVSAGNQFFISGSTALNNQLYDSLLLAPPNGPCKAGTISVYTDAPSTGAPNLKKAKTQVNIVCTLNAAIGTVPANTIVAFSKESSGGSNEGTFYEAAQQALTFWDLTQAPTGCTNEGAAAAGLFYTNQQAITTEFDGCTGVAFQQIPQIGLADEDPTVFNVGPQSISSSLISKLNTTPEFLNQFGIAVSLNLYRALQAQQGLTAQDDTLAQMPTLSRAQIAGLFSGAITNWSQIQGLAANNIWVCRRGDNSGSNVSADIYFLRNRCTVPSPSPMVPVSQATGAPCANLPAGQSAQNNGCTWTAGAAPAGNLSDPVFAGASTGDVAACLDGHSANGDWAVGMLATTSSFDDANGAAGNEATFSNRWRFIAINGGKPTVMSMGDGTYDYGFDNVMNVNKSLAGAPLAIATYIQTQLQTPAVLADIFNTQKNAKSFPGLVADANYVSGGVLDGAIGTPNALPVTLANQKANPVSAFTFQISGSVNNCQVPVTPANSFTKEQF